MIKRFLDGMVTEEKVIGYDGFPRGTGHLSVEDQQFFVRSHLSWMSQLLDYTIQLAFKLEQR